MSDTSVIIIADQPIHRMRSYGPVSLIEVAGKPIIEHQVEALRAIYSDHEIIVVGGFQIDKLEKFLYNKVKIVNNVEYAHTNCAYALKLGLAVAEGDMVIVVNGNSIFNRLYTKQPSHLVYYNRKRLRKDEVGLTTYNNYVSHLSYGLPCKWTGVLGLQGYELSLFKKIINSCQSENLLVFEIINKCIEKNGEFIGLSSDSLRMVSIASLNDIKLAESMV